MLILEGVDATGKSVFYKFLGIVTKNKTRLVDLLDIDNNLDFEKYKKLSSNLLLMDRGLLSHYVYSVTYGENYKNLKYIIKEIVKQKPIILYFKGSYSKISYRLKLRTNPSKNDIKLLNDPKLFFELTRRYEKLLSLLKKNGVKVFIINTDYIPTIKFILKIMKEI